MAALRSIPRAAQTRPTPSGTFMPSYWADRANICPACARSNWLVGRHSAECGFCGTALPIAGTLSHQMVLEQQAA